jgi:glutathione S-transferase
MIIVHHLNNSRSQRILWFLEELGVPYQVQRYQRDPQTMLAPAELKKIHPLGKSPVIVDGDLTLAESAPLLNICRKPTMRRGSLSPPTIMPGNSIVTGYIMPKGH